MVSLNFLLHIKEEALEHLVSDHFRLLANSLNVALQPEPAGHIVGGPLLERKNGLLRKLLKIVFSENFFQLLVEEKQLTVTSRTMKRSINVNIVLDELLKLLSFGIYSRWWWWWCWR